MNEIEWKPEFDAGLLQSPGAWPSRGLQSPSDVADDDWVRLCPISGELIFVRGGPYGRGQDGFVLPRDFVVDRKLVTAADLVGYELGPQLLASEALIEALERAGATGWSATELPHATPNRVVGRRLFVLEVSGAIGALIDTKLGRFGAPITPVKFDATSGTGDDVCWSPWFELGSNTFSDWRALLVRGKVLRALPDPTLFVQPVTVIGEPTAPRPTPGQATRTPVEARRPTPLAGTLDAIAAASEPHALPAGARPDDVRRALRALGLPDDSPLGRLLERFNGAALFDGALVFNYVGTEPTFSRRFEVGDIVEDNDQGQREAFGVAAPGEVALFARSLGGEMYWGIDQRGHVRGYSEPGDVYGPDAPFEDWLADTVADLAFVSDRVADGDDRLEKMLEG